MEEACPVHLNENNMLANTISSLKGPEHRSRFTYRLVAKQDVDIRHDLHQGLLKELADERCWEVHAEDFVVLWSMLRHLQDRLRGHGQEKPLKKKNTIYWCLKQFDWPELNQTNSSALYPWADSIIFVLTAQHVPKWTEVHVPMDWNTLNPKLVGSG